MVSIFEKLTKDEDLPVTIISARRYRPRSERGDQNWIKRFARAGGTVIISGDGRMRANLHEQSALVHAKMITFFREQMVRSKFLRKSGHAAKLVAANYRDGRTIEAGRLLGNSI
jgi:hypothetical protein